MISCRESPDSRVNKVVFPELSRPIQIAWSSGLGGAAFLQQIFCQAFNKKQTLKQVKKVFIEPPEIIKYDHYDQHWFIRLVHNGASMLYEKVSVRYNPLYIIKNGIFYDHNNNNFKGGWL